MRGRSTWKGNDGKHYLAGFNEAPHFHAGKAKSSISRTSSMASSFNEAPHFHAGKVLEAPPKPSAKLQLQ